MARINFFSRVANLWRGFLSLWVSGVEKNHPEIAYENAVQSMTAKYVKLKQATAAIIRRREDAETRLTKEREELAQLQSDLNTAVDSGQDDLALVLIEKKTAADAELGALTTELESAEREAEEAKASLMSVKAEIQRLKAEKDRMLAKMQSAQARVKIQEQIEGLSVDAEVQALDTVREHIKTTIAQANLNRELRESDIDHRLQKLRQQSGSAAAKLELERLKAARAQQPQQQQQATKSM